MHKFNVMFGIICEIVEVKSRILFKIIFIFSISNKNLKRHVNCSVILYERVLILNYLMINLGILFPMYS